MSFPLNRFALAKVPTRNIKQVCLGVPSPEQAGDNNLLENTVFLAPVRKTGKVKKIPEAILQRRPEFKSISEATVTILGEDEAGKLLIETPGELLYKIPVGFMDFMYI